MTITITITDIININPEIVLTILFTFLNFGTWKEVSYFEIRMTSVGNS